MTIAVVPMIWGHIDAVLQIEKQSFGGDAWTEGGFWTELEGVPALKDYVVALGPASGAAPTDETLSGDATEQFAVLGYAGMQFIPPEAEVLTIAVHPDARRRSIGRILVTHLEQSAASRGCEVLHLEVEDANAAARGMYLALGYQEVGRRANYYGSGRDAVLMSKPLAAAVAGRGAGDEAAAKAVIATAAVAAASEAESGSIDVAAAEAESTPTDIDAAVTNPDEARDE